MFFWKGDGWTLLHAVIAVFCENLGGYMYARYAFVDMDISMDIHGKYVDMGMDMGGKFYIHGKPG